MAQLLVRAVDDEVKTRLRRQAKRNGRSMEEEVRDILRRALLEVRDDERVDDLAAWCLQQFGDSKRAAVEFTELRSGKPRPAAFR